LAHPPLPSKFTLARYHFVLEAIEPLHLPPFKGSALRGGFGHTFKRLVCLQPRPCGEHCVLGNACPYGYIFETSPPADSEALRTIREVARPFVIQPPHDPRTEIPTGERLTFGLVLIGQGINYLPYFVAAFRELGRQGLGRARSKYRLLALDAILTLSPTLPLSGGGSAPLSLPGRGAGGEGVPIPIYRAEDDMIRTANATISGDAITAHAATLPPDRITLDFLTPTRLKHQGRWVEAGPPFHVLVKTLLGRISSLSYFHCGHKLETDFRGLIDRAEAVHMAQSQTSWQDWSRFSGRQKQRVEMGGLVGRVTYAGNLRDYLPLLALGEWVHVGKGTVFGNGRYAVGSRE
jgi:hypothetical protein